MISQREYQRIHFRNNGKDAPSIFQITLISNRIPIKFKFVPNSFDDQGIERKRKSATNLRCNLIWQSAYVDAINSSRLPTNVTVFIQVSLFCALHYSSIKYYRLSTTLTCATFIFPFSFSDLCCCCDSRIFCLRCLQFEKVLRFRRRFGILGEWSTYFGRLY